MRTFKIFMVALICMMVSTVAFADRVISPSQLPKAAKVYIQKHYKGQRIIYADVDYDHGFKKYEVKLSNGVELKFDGRGNCYKIDYDDDYFFRSRVNHPQVKARGVIIRHHDLDDDLDDVYDD
ncbi:MAG: PepSY-like domain-containing protein [Prevotella sp.]|nr:PepSY-like domain-containing protein [Prevotella sp.]